VLSAARLFGARPLNQSVDAGAPQAGLPIFGRGYFPYMSINMFKWTASMAVYATAREHYGLKSGASSH
jgi:hypothetical protein